LLIVEGYPVGFPQLAAFRNSDDDFAIFRAFNQCHCRILTQLEVEITEIEKQLLELDRADEANPSMEYRLRKSKHKEGWDTAQRDLLREMQLKLKDYGEPHAPQQI